MVAWWWLLIVGGLAWEMSRYLAYDRAFWAAVDHWRVEEREATRRAELARMYAMLFPERPEGE